MIRALSCVAVCFSIAMAEEPAKGKKDQDAKVKPVPVEASAAIRKSLATCRDLQIHEALPDPVRFPKLHEEELKAAQEHFRLGEVAGSHYYSGNQTYGSDTTGPIIKTLSSPDNLSQSKIPGRFWPENVLTWTEGDETRYAFLSLKSKEVHFSDGANPMRYTLADKAVEALKSALPYMRSMRPDALEETAPLLAALKQGAKITVHEGKHRSDSVEAREEAFKRRGAWLIDGFQFMKTGTPERDTTALRELLLKEAAFETWGGGKACGGFSPDFAATWKVEGRDVSVLICFGCHEALFIDPTNGNLIYDLPKESYDALKEELEKFRPALAGSPPAK